MVCVEANGLGSIHNTPHTRQLPTDLDLRLGEEEGGGAALLARGLVERAQVLKEGVEVVALGQRDLEAGGARHVGGQPRERLLPGPAHADEERRAAGRLEQPADAEEVLERVVEEDQVHALGGELLVVALRERLRPLPHLRQGAAAFVDLGRLLHQRAVLVQHVVPQEAHHLEVRRQRQRRGRGRGRRALLLLLLLQLLLLFLLLGGSGGGLAFPAALLRLLLLIRRRPRGSLGVDGGRRRRVLGEVLREDVAHEAEVHLLVAVVGELVAKDALALVAPHGEQRLPRRERQQALPRAEAAAGEDGLLGREKHALEDTAQLTEVEGVVELGRRGQHPLLHGAPEPDGGPREPAHHAQHVGAKLGGGEATAEHLAVDVVDGGHGRGDEVDEGEVALEAVGHVVAPAPRVLHSRQVLQVLAGLELPALVLVEEGEAAVLHQQPHHLQRGLVPPLVLLRHGQVVDEHRHELPAGRAEAAAAALVELRLDGALAHEGRGGA